MATMRVSKNLRESKSVLDAPAAEVKDEENKSEENESSLTCGQAEVKNKAEDVKKRPSTRNQRQERKTP